MNLDRMTISLEEFLQYLLKKWKLISCVLVICAVLFGVTAVMLGEEIYVPHSEEYLDYEQGLAWHVSYFEESVLMNTDPTKVHQRSILLRNLEDKEVLKNYVTSLEIWDDFDTEWKKTYFTELVTWNETETSETIEIILRHATEKECLDAANYLEEKILDRDKTAEVIIGEEKVIKDDTLQEEQFRWYSRIDYMESCLLEAQAGYTLRVSVPAAIVTGILSGTVGTFFALLFWYVIKGKYNE